MNLLNLAIKKDIITDKIIYDYSDFSKKDETKCGKEGFQ
jgi:hypothetical protein